MSTMLANQPQSSFASSLQSPAAALGGPYRMLIRFSPSPAARGSEKCI